MQSLQRTLSILTIVLLSSMFTLTSCQQNAQSISQKEEKAANNAKSADHSHANQENWQVVAGQMQSPINILSLEAQEMQDSGLMQLSSTINMNEMVINEHNFMMRTSANHVINGRNFELMQFHFHSPSEHTINEQAAAMELHFVHQSQSGRLAVLGVMMQEGEFNPAFEQMLEALANNTISNPELDLNLMLPTNRQYYHYLGSLTTPPLTENVEWYVFAQPIAISSEQLNRYRNHQGFEHSARHTQPMNGRALLKASAN